MADYRFQISGSSAPFKAQLCCFGYNTILQQTAVDYSGTCTIFGNLYPNTCYTVKVTDSIGHSVTCTCKTPVQVGTTTLATKFLCLSGTITSPAPFIQAQTGTLVETPVLSAGECVKLHFTGNTIGGSTCGVNSNVSISCKTCGTGTWVSKGSYTNTNANFIVPPIIVCNGDALCYSMSSTCIVGCTGNLCGSVKLCLSGSSCATGFIPNMTLCQSKSVSVQYTTTTTTTTTTIAPISVYLGGVTNNSASPDCYLLCGHICTSPALTTGQCFRICFTTQACSCTNSPLPKPISACAFLTCGASCCNFASTSIPGSPTSTGDLSSGGYCYIDVTPANIGNITLCVIARSHPSNVLYDYINCGTLCFNAISCTHGGNFVMSSGQCMSARNTTCLADGCSSSSGGPIAPLD